jgi:predicted RNA binding protein YcfA (HicA-like mRNA interferase family)
LAVDDIAVLNSALPELFAAIELPAEWSEDFVFIPVDRPDALRLDIEAGALADNQPDFEVLLDSPLTTSSGVSLPYGGPGAPIPVDSRARFPPPDALAFYLPFHYFFPTWWGVYLIAEGVADMAQRLVAISDGELGLGEAVQVTRLFLYHHEAYHHMVECFATRLELTHRRPLYKVGFERLYRRLLGTGDCLEEALATAQAFIRTLEVFRALPAKKAVVAQALRVWVDGMPPDYRAALNMLRTSQFDEKQDEFAERNQGEAVGGQSIQPSAWANFPQAFRGIGNIKSRVNYIVPKESPIVARARLRLLRPSELKSKLRSLAGCEFLRDGGNHEIWRNQHGRSFPIPRHPRDLATGTVAKILREAGLRMSVTEFLAAR